jgi:hypothetical protein
MRMISSCRFPQYFEQILSLHGVNYVRQTEMRTVGPLALKSRPLDVELATETLQRYKSPSTDQIPAELFQRGGNTLYSEIHRLTKSTWKKEELPQQWKESITVLIYGKSDETDCSNYRGILLLLTTYKISSNVLVSRLTPYVD